MPVTRTPNPMYASGAVYIGGADGSLNASDTDGVDRSAMNPHYSDASGRPALSSSEMEINRRIQEQKASRRLFGVGIMSAIALLLAIVAIATNGGGSGDALVSSSSADLGVFDGVGASTSPANATITNREYHTQLAAHVGWLVLV